MAPGLSTALNEDTSCTIAPALAPRGGVCVAQLGGAQVLPARLTWVSRSCEDFGGTYILYSQAHIYFHEGGHVPCHEK